MDEIEDETRLKRNIKSIQIHHGIVFRHNGWMVPKEQW